MCRNIRWDDFSAFTGFTGKDLNRPYPQSEHGLGHLSASDDDETASFKSVEVGNARHQQRMVRMEANKLFEVLGRCLHQLPRICQRGCHHLLVPVYLVKETTLSTARKQVCVASNRVCTLFSCPSEWLAPGWSSDEATKV